MRAIELKTGTQLAVEEDANRGQHGGTIWDAGLVLAHALATPEMNKRLRGRVVELGAGTGLVGIAAAACAPVHVTTTDLPELVDLMRKNIARNETLHADAKLDAAELCWGDALPAGMVADVVLAADVMYDEGDTEKLASTLLDFIGRTPSCLIVMTHELRTQSPACFRVLQACGLRVSQAPDSWLDPDWRSADIRCFVIDKAPP